MKNIFVMGLESFNLALLNTLSNAGDYRFHELLSYHEAVPAHSRDVDLNGMLDLAEDRLTAFSDKVDAIISYWDFPTSVIRPILCHRHGLVAPGLDAVAACEHKFWCRTEQRQAIPEFTPRFCAVDPFADDPLSQVSIPFPFWIKPVKAHSSYLGFKIRNASEFRDCLPVIRANIGHFGVPFDDFLEMVDVPNEVAGIGGHHCIAEEIISAGRQCTLEGYVCRGEVVVYGVVDSIRSGKHRSCFARYQYPSQMPRRVQDRMIGAARRFLKHIGYDNAPFNAEFYWHPATDEIRILEVNTRISKSHCPLFMMVDGESHHKVAIEVALGRRPDFPHRQGAHRVAAKFMLRVFKDGTVERIPHDDDVRRFKQRFPDGLTRTLATEGMRLAHLPYQDSYSFEIAEIFLGADSQSELLENYRTALQLLPFRLTPDTSPAA